VAKRQRLKPKQIVTLLRQIDVLTTNRKTLAQACEEVETVEQKAITVGARSMAVFWECCLE
jgi:hypothetical protein